MFKTLLATSAIVTLIFGQTLAATQYYVQHKPGATSCAVSEKKPDDKAEIQVGDAHPNKTAAESAMKTAMDCK